MTTRPAAAPALVPYVEGLPELFEASGYVVRLEVQRADGKPLTAEDRKALATSAESYQSPGKLTDRQIAGAVMADLKADKKTTTRTKRAPAKTAARMGRQR